MAGSEKQNRGLALAALCCFAITSNAQTTIDSVGGSPEPVGLYEKYEAAFSLGTVYDNPFDPDEVDVPIPGNDDALRAIRLFSGRMADAILAGRGVREATLAEKAGVAEPVRTPNAAHAGPPLSA